MDFSNASDFSIDGNATFNVVRRDQYNHLNQTFNAEVVHVHSQSRQGSERNELDEFRYIIRGDIHQTRSWMTEREKKSFVRSRRRQDTREDDTQLHISIAKIHGMHQDSLFTVVSYHGTRAHSLWKRDFLEFSRTQNPDALQLFGINRSSIPSLIFYDEMIPIGHVYREGMFWVEIFLDHLIHHSHWSSNTIWLDQSRGRICTGPQGLRVPYQINWAPVQLQTTIPTTLDMLREDVSLRFFNLHGGPLLDKEIISRAVHTLFKYLPFSDVFPGMKERCSPAEGNVDQWPRYLRSVRQPLFPCYLPSEAIEFMMEVSFDTVYTYSEGTPRAIARYPIKETAWTSYSRALKDTVAILESGLTRFTVDSEEARTSRILLSWSTTNFSLAEAWCLQGSGKLSKDELDHSFTIDPPIFELESPGLINIPQTNETIYLFVYPLPCYSMSTIDNFMDPAYRTHFWSFDESGLSEITHDFGALRRDLVGILKLRTWPAYAHEALRKWQVTRGRDPSTGKFAKELGYEKFELVEEKSRVEESFWAKFWTASTELEISAFAF
ncbi:hypothetical protein Moror_2066 [Moniliophthora roreri MCA 2997]|uniref:Uncharacterized protein n=2 Tax=Moniliophthora roreri TaxID=221103 RepID=V2WAE3_MONRO|nr:hypothetical protein Moror_2066 [Moniliophthora roreri MCA 2997]